MFFFAGLLGGGSVAKAFLLMSHELWFLRFTQHWSPEEVSSDVAIVKVLRPKTAWTRSRNKMNAGVWPFMAPNKSLAASGFNAGRSNWKRHKDLSTSWWLSSKKGTKETSSTFFVYFWGSYFFWMFLMFLYYLFVCSIKFQVTQTLEPNCV